MSGSGVGSNGQNFVPSTNSQYSQYVQSPTGQTQGLNFTVNVQGGVTTSTNWNGGVVPMVRLQRIPPSATFTVIFVYYCFFGTKFT